MVEVQLDIRRAVFLQQNCAHRLLTFASLHVLLQMQQTTCHVSKQSWLRHSAASSELATRTLSYPNLSSWVSVFEPGAWSSLRGSDVYLNILETLSGNFSLNSTRLRALGLPLHDFFFFIDCSKPLGESVGLKGMYSISGLRYFLQSGLYTVRSIFVF